MRVGVIIDPVDDSPLLTGVQRQAEAAVTAGLDLCWIRERPAASTDPVSATVLTAAVGAAVADIRLAVQITVGDHPVELAEEVAVVDLTVGGRLSVVIDPGTDERLADETLTLLSAALAPAPFAHHGTRWTVALAGEPTTVLPDPAQPELPIHVLGTTSGDPARRHGMPPVVDVDEPADRARQVWVDLENDIGAARHRWPRMACRRPSGTADDIVESLQREAATWRLGTVVFDLSALATSQDRLAMIDVLGHDVRPRVQLPELPDGVEAMWARRRARDRR